MSILAKKQQVLEVLYDNLNNPRPQVVKSESIADMLEISVKDTCRLLKILDKMGVVVIDIDGHNALITRQGLNHLSNAGKSIQTEHLFRPSA